MKKDPRPRYKKGDFVVCVIAPGTCQLMAGETYEVRDVSVMGPEVLALNKWPGMMWGAWRFRPAKQVIEIKRPADVPGDD